MAAAAKNRVLVGERVSRAGVEAARTAARHDDASIRAAIARCDHDAAATALLARAQDREPVSIELVADVLPGLEWWPLASALIAIGTGDRVAALLPVLEERRFPRTTDALDLEAIALFAVWKAGAPIERVKPILRRLAARAGTVEGYALLATIATSIEDPHVTAACKPIATFAREGAASVAETEKALAAGIDQVLAILPAEVEDATGAGMTVRAAKPPGRNDPCFCGSGNKYKKCCADKPAGAPSPIAGVSWDAFLTTSADQMTVDHVTELPLRDLARVDLTRLPTAVLADACDRLVSARAWDVAERAIDELARRAASGDEPAQTGLVNAREWLAEVAFDCRQPERAWRHIDQLPADHLDRWAIERAIATGPAEAWRALTAAADAALRTDDRVLHVELAYQLLRAAPSLGVIAARACIGAAKFDDADLLLEQVEEVRDELGLAPSDPAWGVLDVIAPQKQTRKRGGGGGAPAEPSDTETKLREAIARGHELERQLAATRAELAAARTQVPAELRRDAAPASALEQKVAELEGIIREGHVERRELRRAVAVAEAAAAAAASSSAGGAGDPSGETGRRVAADDSDDAAGDAVPQMARPVAVPRFEKRAIGALDDVPAAVAAEAMRTVGNLAAGDFAAWRGVKQAKDMPTTILMARVGIHHRLILRSDGRSLEVVDLVPREALLTTLKRLRSA